MREINMGGEKEQINGDMEKINVEEGSISNGYSLESSVNSDSSSSFDLMEDASSSTSNLSLSSSSSSSSGPLYELSDLMANLPIKRGLSKYYEGKSQSYTSLAEVKSLEDLGKRTSPTRKKMKTCKSYGGGLDHGHKSYTPKPTISKRTSKGTFVSSFSRKSSLLSRPSMFVHRNFNLLT